MTLDELYAFIDERDSIYKAIHDGSMSDRERALVRLAKLTEEVGELAEAILSAQGHQRKEKLEKFDPKDVERELADVVITTMLLAKSLNLDFPSALASKMEVVRKRYGTDTAAYQF